MIILIIHIIVSFNQNISLIFLCERWISCQASTPVLCLHYRPETVHCSTKDAYTSELTFLALQEQKEHGSSFWVDKRKNLVSSVWITNKTFSLYNIKKLCVDLKNFKRLKIRLWEIIEILSIHKPFLWSCELP